MLTLASETLGKSNDASLLPKGPKYPIRRYLGMRVRCLWNVRMLLGELQPLARTL